ncbi:hypothetical protein [Streptomyces venezuelae]|uniref:hypothetical protein n=1 Tax=Streptomyces venezuelae TaxID=54571 RepID=UPI00364CD85C
MTTHDEFSDPSGMGEMERGTPQRLETRQRVRTLAWGALCVLLAVWSVAWGVGAVTGTADAWAYFVPGVVLLAIALWARRSAVRNSPPRHL